MTQVKSLYDILIVVLKKVEFYSSRKVLILFVHQNSRILIRYLDPDPDSPGVHWPDPISINNEGRGRAVSLHTIIHQLREMEMEMEMEECEGD
jgi:hypothetical protein